MAVCLCCIACGPEVVCRPVPNVWIFLCIYLCWCKQDIFVWNGFMWDYNLFIYRWLCIIFIFMLVYLHDSVHYIKYICLLNYIENSSSDRKMYFSWWLEEQTPSGKKLFLWRFDHWQGKCPYTLSVLNR